MFSFTGTSLGCGRRGVLRWGAWGAARAPPSGPHLCPRPSTSLCGEGRAVLTALLWPSSPRRQNRREVGAQGPPHPLSGQEHPSPGRRSASDSGGSGASTAAAASWRPAGGRRPRVCRSPPPTHTPRYTPPPSSLHPSSLSPTPSPPPPPRAQSGRPALHTSSPRTRGSTSVLQGTPSLWALGCPGGPGRVQGLGFTSQRLGAAPQPVRWAPQATGAELVKAPRELSSHPWGACCVPTPTCPNCRGPQGGRQGRASALRVLPVTLS